MSTYKFNPKHLYENTNHGLDIIFKYCPQAIGCERTKKQFKLREEESTASATLLQKEDCWIIKDFGDKGYNPIELYRYLFGVSFIEALKNLYNEFGLSNDKIFLSETEFKTNPEQELGYFEVVEAENYNHLDLVGRFLDPKTCLEYDFIPVLQYSFVFINKKTGEKTLCTTKATDNYPIFAYKFCDDWAKIYQPLDKKYKHSYVGKKPTRHVYGLTRLKAIYDETIANFNSDIEEAKKAENGVLELRLIKERDEFKIDKVIICSGGSDGLGVASLGYNVIWFNSESEQLNYAEYKLLKSICHEIYNLPDIDTAGTKYGYQLAEQFWNLKTVWLPESIKQHSGKDFRDWLKKYSKSNLQQVQFQFGNLLTGALKCKFFERTKTKTLKINTAYLHYFLKVKGFYIYYPEKLYLDKTSEQEFIFVRVQDNIIYQEFANTIKKFCERYMIDKGQPVEVINLIKNTTQFTDKNLLGLDPIVLDFKNFTSETQKFYFKNQFAVVSADGIELKPYSKLDSHVWENKIVDYTIFEEKPFFDYSLNEAGAYELKILRTDAEYMNFLINTSRMSWRKELELQFDNEEDAKAYHNENRFRLTSDFLTDEENKIQEQHFLSKLFAIGYMLHKYKRKSFARLLYIMDDAEKESEEERNGGSGKTMILDGIDCLLTNRFKIDGSVSNLFNNPFILSGLTKEADYILIDDLASHYPIDPLYVWITGSINVRPMYKSAHEINFFEAGKIATTRNFGLKNTTGSTLRRIIFISTSDFYHMKSDAYKEERRVSHDFNNKDLFLWEKDSKQPNIHCNFLMQCLQLYLRFRENELLAPSKNIELNNVKAGMGDNFIEWAESYFAKTVIETIKEGVFQETKGTLNEFVPRAEMQDSYKLYAGKFAKTASNFKKSLQQYCKMNGWVFNPKKHCGSDGLIKKPFIDAKGKRQIVEHFYIEVPADILVNDDDLEPSTKPAPAPKKKPEDELPF